MKQGAPARGEGGAASAGQVAARLPLLVWVAWAQALVATLGSLYFSEVMLLTPCMLCWYQRIAMYPLVVVLGVGLLLRERRIRLYVLPLSLTGFAISLFHNLLYFGIIPESVQPCRSGVSCTARQIEWLGFITIPLMALVAFSVISAAMIAYDGRAGAEG